MAKLIAIDGNSLMHRAFYALPAMTNREGAPTGAIYGFLGMLLKLIQQKPEYLVVAFDMHGPTFRHEAFAEYKAGRRATPDELRTQFSLIRELLPKMGITICQCERYEADDILGTFARMANEKGVDALLVTGDRDALQLISPKTHVLMTKKGISDTIEYDEAVLMEQYGLEPRRMIDLKSLMGDGSDNIPGIPGIGEKTALKLLAKYGTMENTLAHAEDEKGALAQKLKNGADSARMSYSVGTIDVNAPIGISLEDTRFSENTLSGGIDMMRKLELRSLIERIPKGDIESAAGDAGEAENKVEHIRIADSAALNKLVDELSGAEAFACHVDGAFTVSMDKTKQYDIVLGETLLDVGLDEDEIYTALKAVLEDDSIKKAFFDSKAMMHAAKNHGVSITNVAFDAMIADYLLHAIHPSNSLKTLSAERLNDENESGAAALMRLWPMLINELEAQGLKKLYDEIELPLISVLFDMETTGFSIDKEALGNMGAELNARIKSLEASIYEAAGESFNILSTKQLGTVLFDKLKLPVVKKTKTGYSTDSEVLESLYDMHPIVPMVLEYRTLTKLCSTFIDGLLPLLDKSGRVHSRFNQNVTATGRISSTEPNLQNIPVRTELGREIRKAFVASEGRVLIDADYSQIELRLLAAMSGDAGMCKAFLDGADIHRRTASEVFGVPFEDVTGEQRSAAKAVNFGIVYGISDYGLARQLGITRKQAARYIELYFDRYPDVQAFLKQCVAKAKEEGAAKTLFGRRREMPELSSSNYNTRSFGERVAMNMPIQGTAADIIKLAMVRVHNGLKERGYKAKLILQIHDELIIDAPREEAESVAVLLKECMESVVALKVPLIAEVHMGHSWYDTK